MRIEIDYDGYPIEVSLEELRNCADPTEALNAARGYFEYVVYGSAEVKDGLLYLVTGGWSGCESVINAINPVVHGLLWESSHRGGLHVYRIPK